MAIHFTIIRNGNDYSAAPDGDQPFAVGRQVVYGNKTTSHTVGLANDGSSFAKRYLYTADAFRNAHPFWADFIEPTAICEGQSFLTLNTYDRAFFTFGFAQFSAHVPNGDFVLWLRDMLQLPDAPQYFPDLVFSNGQVCQLSDGVAMPLEGSTSTQLLMTYLNPTLDAVEDAEVLAAARLMHWTVQDPQTQELQVRHMVQVAKGHVSQADKRLGLDGKSALLCLIIFDILHQGRGRYSDMQHALLDPKPDAALLQIGGVSEPGRCANLKKALTPVRPAMLNSHTWNSARRDFT